jgi:predicted small lipoprotein YifL
MMVTRVTLVAMVLAGTLAGCGRVGFPVPPDDYGIGVRLQAERQKEAQARKEQEAREAAARKADEDVPAPPEEPILPEMRPLTGR